MGVVNISLFIFTELLSQIKDQVEADRKLKADFECQYLIMEVRRNRRKHVEHFCEGHLKLDDLKQEARKIQFPHCYPYKEDIPAYPRPEFHVSHLKHDTDRGGLCGIRRDRGFKNPVKDCLVWWGLNVGPEEIASAERRLLETTYPDRTEEQVQMQQSFLEKFATSPAFMESSRLGSYRFTFPVEEVLKAYSKQFCGGAQPVMRQFRTVLYKQEVVYVVLVHSPANQEEFLDYPLLTEEPNPVCAYKDGRFIWRSEAMCETHRYELVQKPDEKLMEAMEVTQREEYYVWDNVAIALLVDDQVLKFDADRLRQNLKFCEMPDGMPTASPPWKFDDFSEAQMVVRELWPDDQKLRRAEPLNQEMSENE